MAESYSESHRFLFLSSFHTAVLEVSPLSCLHRASAQVTGVVYKAIFRTVTIGAPVGWSGTALARVPSLYPDSLGLGQQSLCIQTSRGFDVWVWV